MTTLRRRDFLKVAAAGAISFPAVAAEPAPAARPTVAQLARKLPRWRGFNLLEKFNVGRNERFVADDFQWMVDWGFDFVRLPMDYRCWTSAADPYRLDEKVLAEIDEAVELGRRHGVHVSLNLHRAPGYTVARPPETLNLWTDAEAQQQFDFQWATFARRYKGVPAWQLSFDLVNEPANVENEVYAKVARRATAAIRKEDSERLVISDGNRWGNEPIFELADLGIAQSTRGYQPSMLTHYEASWVNSQGWPEPTWPRLLPPNGTLLSPAKPEGSHPLVIDGPFASPTELRLRVLVVSVAALLVVEADGERILEKSLRSGPGEGEWKEARFNERYKIYQNLFDRDYAATIPAGTKQVRVRVVEGDWLQVGRIGLRPEGQRESTLALSQRFGVRPEPVRFVPGQPGGPFQGVAMEDREWLRRTAIDPWKKLAAAGVGVHVGEWGSYNKTPHAVVLAWARDFLDLWKEADFGWALWNFRGSFGILDSGRADVDYEDFHGRKLDRKLLDLLRAG